MPDQKIIELISNSNSTLNKINQERRRWLYVSSVVYLGLIFLIFTFDSVFGSASKTTWWAMLSVMIIISINWWYWTIKVLVRLLNQRQTELQIMAEIIVNLQTVKETISELNIEIEKLSK